jgi:hypothetical protein
VFFCRKCKSPPTHYRKGHPVRRHECKEGRQRYKSPHTQPWRYMWAAPSLGRSIPGKQNRYPLHRKLGRPRGRSGKSRPHRGSNPGPSSQMSRAGPAQQCSWYINDTAERVYISSHGSTTNKGYSKDLDSFFADFELAIINY